MFEQYNEIFLQRDAHLKTRGRSYSITSDHKQIGTLEETTESSKNIANQLLKLTSLFIVVSLEMVVLDRKANVLGTIKKEKGFYKNFSLLSESGEPLASIKPTIKVNSPKMTVIDFNGSTLLNAIGGYGGTDFSILDGSSRQQVATIKRRSLVYTSIKDNLLNDDGYYINNNNHDKITTLALIAMGIILDMYYFNN